MVAVCRRSKPGFFFFLFFWSVTPRAPRLRTNFRSWQNTRRVHLLAHSHTRSSRTPMAPRFYVSCGAPCRKQSGASRCARCDRGRRRCCCFSLPLVMLDASASVGPLRLRIDVHSISKCTLAPLLCCPSALLPADCGDQNPSLTVFDCPELRTGTSSVLAFSSVDTARVPLPAEQRAPLIAGCRLARLPALPACLLGPSKSNLTHKSAFAGARNITIGERRQTKIKPRPRQLPRPHNFHFDFAIDVSTLLSSLTSLCGSTTSSSSPLTNTAVDICSP